MLSVGLNAAPLLAPRTGVGRYILGLAGGLERIAGSSPEREFELRALFAPRTIFTDPAPAPNARPSKLGRVRALVKALPAAYELADLARGALLAAEPGLDVFHETNHAPPLTRRPLVLTIHDLCTILQPETQEPARARFFAKTMRARAKGARVVITPTQAIARQVVDVLGLEPKRVRAIHHGVDVTLSLAGAARAPVLAQHGVGGPYLLFVGAIEPRKGLPALLDAYD
ncbi:MAG: glycosyltransferase, partial [Deltaproteobacteria bacterium]|nr:glycosyltransferase [Deltaproteobacteria bacterium]